ncbi:MAG: class F420-dependent oxidoreductase [Frankiales bacterium]|jgi:probable F420-dependent oxidoreductase|nr:class F420-dependent oxidoreductase [Frankiales bacterium]
MSVPAQLSLVLPSFTPQDTGDWSPVIDLAVAADRAGVDRVVVSEHVAFGENLEAYADPSLGGQRDGRQPTGPDGPWLDPLVTLSYVAALTERVRLGTAILIAALRRPVVLAKTAATLDVLSRGRLDLGVGVGWQREEYDAAGLPFQDRGRLLDHTLEVCQLLWREATASYRSDELAFDRIHQAPKPVQAGGVPLWVSGTVNKRSMDRLARFGTGWVPWGDDAADIGTGIQRMRSELAARGRDGAEVQVMTRLPTVRTDAGADVRATLAPATALHRLGVTDFRIGMRVPAGRAAAQTFLEEVVGTFHDVVGR